jgi:SOS-response transcriptional repressor LexA
MKYGLTDKQLKLFNFIKKYIDENNMAPSYEEMKVGTGVSSKCLIFVKINQLQERGWIEKLPGKNRSIIIKV